MLMLKPMAKASLILVSNTGRYRLHMLEVIANTKAADSFLAMTFDLLADEGT